MADTQSSLVTGTSSGLQSATQSPQAATQQQGSEAANASSFQPVSTQSLLTSTGGIPISQQSLPSVSLSGTSTSTTKVASTPAPVAKHHVNPFLGGLAIAFFVGTIIAIFFTARSAKNTTL